MLVALELRQYIGKLALQSTVGSYEYTYMGKLIEDNMHYMLSSPQGKTFLTQHSDSVKVFNSLTGLLHTINTQNLADEYEFAYTDGLISLNAEGTTFSGILVSGTCNGKPARNIDILCEFALETGEIQKTVEFYIDGDLCGLKHERGLSSDGTLYVTVVFKDFGRLSSDGRYYKIVTPRTP